MVYFLEISYFLILLHAIARCLYFWQLKEYRWDRFREIFKSNQLWQYLLPSRWFFRPRLTVKIVILIYMTVYLAKNLNPVLAYITVPLITAVAVMLLKPITDISYQLIIFLARLKLKLFHQHLTVIAITGSYAKTSVKTILAHLLKAKYAVWATPATNNTAVGVSLTVLKDLRPKHQVFVVEMGAYKKGEIKQICRLVKPKIGILTGITQQHLSLFGSFKRLKQAKYELIEALPANGLAVFNAANHYTAQLAKQTRHVSVLTYNFPKKDYNTNLLGHFQQLNLQAAVSVSRYLKVSLKKIQPRLQTIPVTKTMMTQKTGLNQCLVIDDSYNANPAGFLAAVDYLRSLSFRKKILITSGIIELGSAFTRVHTQLAQASLPVFERIYLTKPEVMRVFQSVKSTTRSELVYQPDYGRILKELKSILDQDTVVLLASRLAPSFIDKLCPNRS